MRGAEQAVCTAVMSELTPYRGLRQNMDGIQVAHSHGLQIDLEFREMMQNVTLAWRSLT